MKTFAIVSGALIVGILVVLGSEVLSQQKSNKVDVFHESLKQEQAKQIKKSIQALDAIYKENKDDYLINLRLGWLQYSAKNYEESKKYYGTATSLAGNKSIEALLGRTLPLAALNDWDAVESTYASILKLDPMHYTANLRLGQIMLNKGVYSEAKTYLERAHAFYPGEYEPNLSLGWTCYYLGDKQKATSLLTTALMLSPGDTLATQGLQLAR